MLQMMNCMLLLPRYMQHSQACYLLLDIQLLRMRQPVLMLLLVLLLLVLLVLTLLLWLCITLVEQVMQLRMCLVDNPA